MADPQVVGALSRIEVQGAATHELLKDHIARDDRVHADLARAQGAHGERVAALEKAVETLEDKLEVTQQHRLEAIRSGGGKPWWARRPWKHLIAIGLPLATAAFGWLAHHLGLHP